MISEALRCPREVFLGKTMSCTDVRDQSKREKRHAERPLNSACPIWQTSESTELGQTRNSDKPIRMLTEARQSSKSDEVPASCISLHKPPILPHSAIMRKFLPQLAFFCHPARAANLSRTADDGGTLHSGALGAELEMLCQTQKRRLDILVRQTRDGQECPSYPKLKT